MSHTVAKEAEGGTYTEGVLTSSQTMLSEAITSLTNVGLTRLGEDGSIQPALAKSWQISADGKTYAFTLQNNYYSSDLIPFIRQQKGSWNDVEITARDSRTLQFVLKKPYGLFLSSTLRPIFPYGPYKKTGQDNKEIVLTANTDSALNPPYLKKIIFRLYEDKSVLIKDLQNGKLSATGEELEINDKNIQSYSFNLPRHYVAFFNTSKTPFSDKKIRQQLISGQTFSPPIKITILRGNTESALNFSQELQNKWSDKGVIVNEVIDDTVTLVDADISKKAYDVFIYGFNTGYYDDFYAYWHSSQQPPTGMNFGHIKNRELDRLLEEGRVTLDPKIRQEKFTQAKTINTNEAYAVFATPSPSSFYVNKEIKGIRIKSAVLPTDRFTFADKWYIKTRRVNKYK